VNFLRVDDDSSDIARLLFFTFDEVTALLLICREPTLPSAG
jgi:hypothetical protein